MRYASLILLASCIILAGCRKGAEPGTPEWAVQQASAAASKKDWKTYATFFTEETAQRVQVHSCISTILRNEDARRLARGEGPQSIAAVNRILGDDSAFKKKYKITQEWIDEVEPLESDEQHKRIDQFLETIEDPGAMWVEFVDLEVALDADFAPLRWGRIDKVENLGDTAVVHTYTAGFGSPRKYPVDLKKVDGEWKIENK